MSIGWFILAVFYSTYLAVSLQVPPGAFVYFHVVAHLLTLRNELVYACSQQPPKFANDACVGSGTS